MRIKVNIEYILEGDGFLPLDEIRNNLMNDDFIRDTLMEGEHCVNFECQVEGVVDDNCS